MNAIATVRQLLPPTLRELRLRRLQFLFLVLELHRVRVVAEPQRDSQKASFSNHVVYQRFPQAVTIWPHAYAVERTLSSGGKWMS